MKDNSLETLLNIFIGVLFLLPSFFYQLILYIKRKRDKKVQAKKYSWLIPITIAGFIVISNCLANIGSDFLSKAIFSYISPKIGAGTSISSTYESEKDLKEFLEKDNIYSSLLQYTKDRNSYTIEQINRGVLGDRIIFNSISDGDIGHEFNFVGARIMGENKGQSNIWYSDEIEAVDGETYLVRIYAHNDNPLEYNAIAQDVTIHFTLPKTIGKRLSVQGSIDCTNAWPPRYYDDVEFVSEREFYLDYIEGSALLENSGIGSKGGYKLSDDIIFRDGAKIGYEEIDGRIPGGFKYDNYITIKVKPVFGESK